MKTISITEPSRGIDHYLDVACRSRKVFHIDTMSDAQRQEMINRVAKSEMPQGNEHLDDMLKD